MTVSSAARLLHFHTSKPFASKDIIAPMTKLLALVIAFLALTLGACSAQVDESAPPNTCEAFDACAAIERSIVDCSDGSECWCMAPTHPGENTPVSCRVGAPVSKP